jgi:hypothetical protein
VGWIGAEVEDRHIETAKHRFLERQARCNGARMGHRFNPDNMPTNDIDTENDHRWSGDLGEMLVKDYLEQRGFSHQWLADYRESEFDIDFVVRGQNIDVKTKRRKKIPQNRQDYFETVNHEQFVIAETREVAGYMFCDYAYEDQWIYLIGTVSYQKFDRLKIWRPKGSTSNACLISADSWDIPIPNLAFPIKWGKRS